MRNASDRRRTAAGSAPGPALRRLLGLPPWAGRNYCIQTAATVISSLGNSGAVIASAFAVLHSGGDGTDVGLVAAARTVPLVVFLLVGGTVADRFPRHRVMVVANSGNAVSQAVFAAMVLDGSAELWHMMLLSGIGGSALAFFYPAAQGVILTSVDSEHAGKAFAAFRVGVNGANIGGAALGGALIAAFGPGWVLAIDAAAFAVAAGLRAFMTAEERRTASAGGMLSDLREGWHEFVSRPWLWGIVLQFSVVNAVVVVAEAVYGPIVAEESLGGAGPWGLAMGAFGVGTLLGGLLMMRWKPRRPLLAGTLGVFPVTLPLAALAVPAPWWVLAAAMLVCGVGFEVFGVAWMLALQQEIPEDRLSRVAAYDALGSFAFIPLATGLAGPAADAFGMPTALWGAAALAVTLTAAVLVLPEVRQLTRREEPPVAPRSGAPQAQPPADAAAEAAEA